MIAGRYLRSRRREAFISVIAGFSFIGIMLGVATLIIVMAVMNGFRAELIDKILGLNGHLILQRDGHARSPTTAPVADRIAARAGRQVGDAAGRGAGARERAEHASSGVLVRGIRDQDLPKVAGIYQQRPPRHARRLRRVRRRRHRHAPRGRPRPHHRRQPHAGVAARQRHAARASRRASRPIRSWRSSRSACRNTIRPSSIMPFAEAQALFQPRRRGERDRDLPRRCRRRSSALRPADREGREPARCC